jgi:hypothetical protein
MLIWLLLNQMNMVAQTKLLHGLYWLVCIWTQVFTLALPNTRMPLYAKEVIAEPYSLISDYRQLMLADNNLNTSEFILTISFDGNCTKNWGGTNLPYTRFCWW